MKLVYVAGPYRSKLGSYGVHANIHEAWKVGVEVAAIGHYPVIPHTNTLHMDGLQSDQFFLDGTLELMARCDAVLMMSTWEQSAGARGEHEAALNWSMPVFYSLEALAAWGKV